MAILLAILGIYGACKLEKIIKHGNFWLCVSLIVLFNTLIIDVINKSPIHSIFKSQLFTKSSWMKDNDAIIQFVPPGVSVAAQNNLFPHLSQRNEIYLLPEINNAQYIGVELHGGPNAFSPLQKEEVQKLIDGLIAKNEYSIDYHRGDAMLLRKN